MSKVLPIIAASAAGIGGAIAGYLAHDEVKKDIDYGSYLIPHKYYVYKASREMGLPLTRALGHDLSKFRPDEWKAYSDWFNGPGGLHGERNRETFLNFRKGVEKHYTRNEHHWRPKHIAPNDVPLDVKLESIADWYGVNRARGNTKENFKNWFERKKETFPIDKPTVNEAERRLLKMSEKKKEVPYTSLEYIVASGDPMVRALTRGLPPSQQKSIWRRYAQVVLRNRNYGRKNKIAGEYIKTKEREA